MDHTYDITAKRTGGYRAECLVVYPDGKFCGWHFDTGIHTLAEHMLRQHMHEAHDRRIQLKEPAA